MSTHIKKLFFYFCFIYYLCAYDAIILDLSRFPTFQSIFKFHFLRKNFQDAKMIKFFKKTHKMHAWETCRLANYEPFSSENNMMHFVYYLSVRHKCMNSYEVIFANTHICTFLSNCEYPAHFEAIAKHNNLRSFITWQWNAVSEHWTIIPISVHENNRWNPHI